MLDNTPIDKVLFLDIETVPVSPEFSTMPEILQPLWEKKSSHFRKETETASDVYQRAGIYAEFGKIICISLGIFYNKNNNRCLRLKSFYGDDERDLLLQFAAFLAKNNQYALCAHNGKEFDFPYLSRRMLINRIPLPAVLDVAGKKPWETNFIDTMDLWKFGDFKNFTSLDLLAAVFGIPSSKDDIDGSMVAHVYWKEKDLKRIVRYCEKDVTVIARVLLHYKLEPALAEENIESSTPVN